MEAEMIEKILITGGSGTLGKELIHKFPKKEIHSTFRNNKSNEENAVFLDITNQKQLNEKINEIKPEIIIHTAAITNLDWCENNKDETFLTNVSATRFLTELAKKNNSKLIFISTDSVFDGKKGDYREDDSQNAVNVYSESKIEAEKIVNEYSNSLILRGTFVGKKSVGKNESFFYYLLNQLKKENKIKVPNDKISNGLSVNDYSELLVKMYENDLTGTYHIGTIDAKNNFEFAKGLAKECGYNEELIQECAFADIFSEKGLTAKRPLNTTLNVEKISSIMDMPSYSQTIKSIQKQI